MKLHLPDRSVDVFSVLYREESIQEYAFRDLKEFIRLSEEYRYTGLLLFESNRGNIEPWVFAQAVLNNSETLSPFIAANPAYMHPFLVAKKILSLASLYQRKVYINFITGTSKTDLAALGDTTAHDDRYKRLVEFIQIIDGLLNDVKPLTFDGKFYKLKNAKLSSNLPEKLKPVFFVAGASEESSQAAKIVGANKMGMAKPVEGLQQSELAEKLHFGLHFGIIARESRVDATERLNELFYGTEEDKDLMEYSMTNTDGKWKRELNDFAELPDSTYNLQPFKNFKSDCPYHVGSYDELSDSMVRYVINGFDPLVIEVPPGEDELWHISNVLKLTEQKICSQYYSEKQADLVS
ncbi:LLM class flavin-dependent oxidoreductase [Flavitalea sp. BT771]|uniref:LLM class flavin-dependent oxidoreductase n=1 Tax=Flavitalea sp. BT771 TaxID=3063329 RepID=UPI0026E219BD|nr:LLM class flavin-dependent oxidoreductase [Flavitalea sp. BT771]MDO6435726.1 LLM class flavin-dependent oxidoreductase [Flavitalea sp. BT771]MDV6224621.1 LLM class flavin-dependent oxidoreductase [Flavitalea sp. BT771]